MPELPEVETVRLGLEQATLEKSIVGVQVLRPQTIAAPAGEEEFRTSLIGQEIYHWHRRGKYLLAALRDAQGQARGWLGVHLRMTGQLLWLEATVPLAKHTRVRIFFAGQQELRFVDQRTFGQMWWVPPDCDPASIVTGLQRLGPEPFDPAFSVRYLQQQLKGRRPIKSALLDQQLVAGIGNIYADEALFLSGIHPTIACGELQPDQIQKLQTAVVQVLKRSLEAGGTTFSSFLDVKGINGNYGGVAWVYNRKDQPCRWCSSPIQRLRLGGRSTHFCPQCQPIPGNATGSG